MTTTPRTPALGAAGVEAVALTKAQTKFIRDCPRRGWAPCVLLGAETRMARRLEEHGLMERRFIRGEGDIWFATEAGLSAITKGSGK